MRTFKIWFVKVTEVMGVVLFYPVLIVYMYSFWIVGIHFLNEWRDVFFYGLQYSLDGATGLPKFERRGTSPLEITLLLEWAIATCAMTILASLLVRWERWMFKRLGY